MSEQITVGATAVMTSLVGLTLLARWWVRPEPSGRHRAPTLVLLRCPTSALDTEAAFCRAEGRVTVHARTRITKQFVCTECRSSNPDPIANDEARQEAS
ncbi:MAG: hypothetical protein HOV66_15160 [Streptomycetaceae bacterium]|nr:hypothetical protein [Streptomycetaceae bacterium]